MYLCLKIFHIGAMAVWFAGLCFLPHLFRARQRRSSDNAPDRFNRLVNILYFRVMTPAGALTVVFGTILLVFASFGAWLVMKMLLVLVAVFTHLYLGKVMYELGHGRERHGPWFYHLLGWLPLTLALALAALTAAKPDAVGHLPAAPRVGDISSH